MVTVGAIEDGIPVPRRGRPSLYPFDKLQPGQSFLVVGRGVNAVRAAASARQKRTGHIYSVRADGAGVRVWRVE